MNKKNNAVICLVVGLLFLASLNPLQAQSGSGFDEGIYHTGIDIGANPGDEFRSPVSGVIKRLEVDPVSTWSGLVIEANGNFSDNTFRFLGIKSSLKVGDAIAKGDVLGLVQDPRLEYPDIKPYVHVEHYSWGKRVDPQAFVKTEMLDYKLINAGSESSFHFEKDKYYKNGRFLFFERRDYEEALYNFLEALKYPEWEGSNTVVYRDVARAYAKLGNFELATHYMDTFIRLMYMELEYSKGNLPAPELGVIASVNKPEYLEFLIPQYESIFAQYKQHVYPWKNDKNEQRHIH